MAITDKELLQQLKDSSEALGQATLAKLMGIAPGLLNQTLKEKLQISDKLGEKLGYKKAWVKIKTAKGKDEN